MKKIFPLLSVFTLLISGTISAHASPLYDFAFSIPVDGGGSITGEIIGLEDNATSTPYDIIITSDPFNPDVGSGGYSLKDNGYIANQYVDDEFVVSDGMIVGTESDTGLSWYKVLNAEDPFIQIAYNFDFFGSSNGESYQLDEDTTLYGNENGFVAEYYSPGTLSSVPEPGQWAWAVVSIMAIAGLGRRFSSRRAWCAGRI